MSDEFVHIPLQDVTRRVEAPDAMREALDAAARAQGLQTAPEHKPYHTVPQTSQTDRFERAINKNNRIIIALPPGLQATENLLAAVQGTIAAYIQTNRDEILAGLMDGVKVEK